MILPVFFLLLACAPLPWPPPPAGWAAAESLATTAALLSVPPLVATVVTRRTARRLLGHPFLRPEILRKYNRFRARLALAILAAFAVALVGLGWGATARLLVEPWPGAELLVLTPFLASQILCWAVAYPLDRLIAETADIEPPSRPFGGRLAYIVFHARQQFALAGIPVALVILEQSLARAFPGWFQGWTGRLSGLAAVAVILAAVPWMLRAALNLRRMPDGSLRRRLERAAERMRLRYTDLLVWDTRGGVANAVITGILPFPRYVVFTDRLLAELTPEELVGVMGHEAGHVRHGHITYYAAFLTLSFAVAAELAVTADRAAPLWPALDHWRQAVGDWEAVPALALVGVYLLTVFGFVSRRCERQADLAGCRVGSCGESVCFGHEPRQALPAVTAETPLCPVGVSHFIAALEKVGRLNGLTGRKPRRWQAWQHDTIESRIAFLRAVSGDPDLEAAFQRRLGRLRRLLIAALLVSLAALLGWNWAGG